MQLPDFSIQKAKAKTLYTALESFKKNILAIDPEIAKQLGPKIPLNLEIPEIKIRKQSHR